MSKFQIGLLVVFGFFIITAVMVFALYRGGGSTSATVTIWGDISSQDFNLLVNAAALSSDQTLAIRYSEKSADTLEAEFTEALARGSGPDLVMISQDKFWKEKSKLLPIPYENISERDFTETFIEEGELFLTEEGIYALPLSVDPMVLYYNRDILSSAGQSKPLAYWDEIYVEASKLTKRDAAGNLTQSTIALGETRNIPNAKDIISLLMLQAGTPITGFIGPDLRSLVATNFDLPVMPVEAALEFYTQFSNPSKSYYSWNRTMPEADTHFTSGDSAYYLGFASELRALRNKNPTLNFGVAPIPQSRVSGKILTFGRLQGVAISRGTTNPSAALTAALKLVSYESAAALSQILSLPPARRDLLSQEPTDTIGSVFYEAALQSNGWLDPNDTETEMIFGDMIEDVTSGRTRVVESVNKASRELEALIN